MNEHKGVTKLKEFLNDNHNLVFEKMESKGYEVYIVGGSVRDSLLGKEVDDIDFTTSATPEQIMEVFSEYTCLDNGLKHGTVPVIINGEMIEITTYRIDGDYSDGRRPDDVEFTTSLEEDLERRDFTINSLAYNPATGIVDLKGGKEDLAAGVIRAVGNAEARFEEDALRIMRGLRFASRLGFSIEEETKEAMLTKKSKLKEISAERINVELKGILLGKYSKRVLSEFKEVIFEVIPELSEMDGFEQNNPFHKFDVWNHTLEVLENVREEEEFKLAALFHDVGKPSSYKYNEEKEIGQFLGHEEKSVEMAEVIMRRLKYSNKVREKTLDLIMNHGKSLSKKPYKIKKLIFEMGPESFLDMVEFQLADNKGKIDEKVASKNKDLEEISKIAREYLSGTPILSHKDLDLDAKALVSAGIKGAALGEVLTKLVLFVLSGGENRESVLLSAAVRLSKES